MNFIDLNFYYKDNREMQLFKEGYLINDFGFLKSNFDTMKYGLSIIDIIDKHCKLDKPKTSKRNNKTNPWITQSLINSIKTNEL